MNSAEASNMSETEATPIENKIEDYSSESEDEFNTDALKCRMYENDYPEQGELVMVQIKNIFEKGAYCNLLEYNNIEGLLLNTELRRKRIRSIKSVIKEGRQIIVRVYRVDKSQHFIDLSKKRVDIEDVPRTEEKWNKSKTAHSIMRQICVLSNQKYSMKQLYKLFGWKCAKDFVHLYDGFKFAMNNWNEFIIKYPMPKEIETFLQKMIEKRLKPQIVTVRAKVEITCFTYEGVDAIKRALKVGFSECNQNKDKEGMCSNDMNLKIALVAPPLFTISVSTFQPKGGVELIENVIDLINESISKAGGTLTVRQKPQVISGDHES